MSEAIQAEYVANPLAVEILGAQGPPGPAGVNTWGSITGTLSSQADLQAALDAKAPIASPTFTGIPAAPTAAQGTNTTQLATTAFVRSEVAALVASAPGALDTLDELAAALGDDANFATTVTNSLALKAGLGSANMFTAAQVIQSNAAAAFAVGPNGATNPVLQVDGSVLNSATGIKVTPAAAGAGVTIGATSSASNEKMRITAKGGGDIELLTTGSTLLGAAGGFQWRVSGGTGFLEALNDTTQIAWGSNQDTRLLRDAAHILAQRNSTNPQTHRIYGTFTDASNYVRASLAATSTTITLAAETAGTGADDVTLNLTAAGTGTIKCNSQIEYVAGNTQTTVGAAGGAAALPATPTGYLKFNVGGTTFAVPYYASA